MWKNSTLTDKDYPKQPEEKGKYKQRINCAKTGDLAPG